jgi:hypothetical protein
MCLPWPQKVPAWLQIEFAVVAVVAVVAQALVCLVHSSTLRLCRIMSNHRHDTGQGFARERSRVDTFVRRVASRHQGNAQTSVRLMTCAK